MITWPDELVSAIARRRSVIFLGAGASMNSVNAAGNRPPSWTGFLQSGIERLPAPQTELKRLLREKDFLSCCQILKYKMGYDWVPLLEETFLTPQFRPADIHRQVLRLDSSIVVTPNFDKIYDNHAMSATGNLFKVKKHYDDDIPRVLRGSENQRLILKIHGCIDTPDKLIFTREDYADIRSKYANFYRAVDALILTHTFLFIGCSMTDPDLMLMLEQYARSFGAAPPHFVALAGKLSDEYTKMLQDNYNLRVLKYSDANQHKELLESIEKLNECVEDRRDKIAASNLW
jgi:hypothetical protein